MTTPLDIITDALQKLGVYAPSEELSGADSERGLQALSDLIDQWADDSIRLYILFPIAAGIVTGQQTYTVGEGGNVDVERPARVVTGPRTANFATGAGPTNFPLDSVSAIEWNAIYNTVQPGPQFQGTPTTIFYDPQAPLGLLSLFPTPSVDGLATISGYYGLSGFTNDLTTADVTLAPGQRLGLVTNLAASLAPYFISGAISPEILAQAQQSKTVLTLTNRQSRAMSARNVQPPTPVAPRQ